MLAAVALSAIAADLVRIRAERPTARSFRARCAGKRRLSGVLVEGLARTRAGEAALVVGASRRSWHCSHACGYRAVSQRGALGIALSIFGVGLIVLGRAASGENGQVGSLPATCRAVRVGVLGGLHDLSDSILNRVTAGGSLRSRSSAARWFSLSWAPGILAENWAAVAGAGAWAAIAYSGLGALVTHTSLVLRSAEARSNANLRCMEPAAAHRTARRMADARRSADDWQPLARQRSWRRLLTRVPASEASEARSLDIDGTLLFRIGAGDDARSSRVARGLRHEWSTGLSLRRQDRPQIALS